MSRSRADDGPTSSSERRGLCVLVTQSEELTAQARTLMRQRHVPMIVIASESNLHALMRNVVPAHVVIDRRVEPGFDVLRAFGSTRPSVRVHWTRDDVTALVALGALADDR